MIKQSRRFNIQLINLNVHLQYLFYQVQIIIFKGDTLFMKQQYDEAIIEYQKAANLNIRYCINIGNKINELR
ncbi:hypothetical protein FGO68_gene16258 [Halteria grandinella]|uniref:Tetratricopeptide repeat protein n=1 Tax=Halteria grandinella TaxID=5974 RepID=A0A8J8NH48_HALGN|nr:hypothetical protein FGO68_gene16258 [Halteria grandinella]